MGWNKPLLHRWEHNLNLLQSELRNYSPRGNRLRNSWRLDKVVGLIVNARVDGVTIRNPLVWARIADRGGTIIPVRAPWLQFQVNGKWVRTQKSVQKKTDYIRKAVDAWAGNPQSIKARWGRVGERS